MKLPRWLVLCLLATSAVAALATGVSWWITWPTRTILEFTELLQQGRFDEANRYLESPTRLAVTEINSSEVVAIEGLSGNSRSFVPYYSAESWRSWCTAENLELESRTVTERVLGCQRFSYHQMFTTPVFIGGHAERGRVVLRYENWATGPF